MKALIEGFLHQCPSHSKSGLPGLVVGSLTLEWKVLTENRHIGVSQYEDPENPHMFVDDFLGTSSILIQRSMKCLSPIATVVG